jgi:hypothetical protein
MRRAQVTVFIVLGIVILLTAGIILAIVAQRQPIEPAVPDASVVRLAVEQCLHQSALDGLVQIGLRGGYDIFPENLSIEEGFQVPYYFIEDHVAMPQTAVIEEQLDSFIEDDIDLCLQRVLQNLSAEADGLPIASSSISAQKVSVTLDYPIAISDADAIVTEHVFTTQVTEVRIAEILASVQEALTFQAAQPDLICTSCYAMIGRDHNLEFDIEKLDSAAIVTAIDVNHTIDSEPYMFIFAVKYRNLSCDSPIADAAFHTRCLEKQLDDIEDRYPLRLLVPGNIHVTDGDNVSFTINASGLGVSYYDMSPLFDINATTGEIHFIPQATDVGTHQVTIYVKDLLGDEDYGEFNLTVEATG